MRVNGPVAAPDFRLLYRYLEMDIKGAGRLLFTAPLHDVGLESVSQAGDKSVQIRRSSWPDAS